MSEHDVNGRESDMEVENFDDHPIQATAHPQEILPLALVAVNVDDQRANLDDDQASTASSRVNSPVNIAEESNHGGDEELPHSSRKRTLDETEDGTLCPICLDNWTNIGEHRICALKCGHLFGYSCVMRWLNTQRRKACPTCNKHANRNDVRHIYAQKLAAVDVTELETVKKQLDVMTEARNRAYSDLAKYVCQQHQLNQTIEHLRSQLNAFTNPGSAPKRDVAVERVRLYMEKSMVVCSSGASRVFDIKSELDLLVVSLKSPNNLFAGFGLKKISISDYRSTAFIPVHSLAIRDICFHQQDNWVLTASMDKTFKVLENRTNKIIYQYSHQMPLWSCCWDLNNNFLLYVGTQSGAVLKYDIRQLTEPVSSLSVEGDMSPVVSVASIPATPGVALAQGGVVSCKLNSLWLYENSNEEYLRHPLSLDGPFVSMKYRRSTRQLLVSSRPNNRVAHSRHTLCTLDKSEVDKIDCNIVHSFQGGGMQKLLSKSCFVSDMNDYVAAHQEDCRSVYLWSISTGQKVGSVAAHQSVLDLKGLQNQHGSFLVSLTDRKLEFFKFF